MCLIKPPRDSQCIIKAKCLDRSVNHMMKFCLTKLSLIGLWREDGREEAGMTAGEPVRNHCNNRRGRVDYRRLNRAKKSDQIHKRRRIREVRWKSQG